MSICYHFHALAELRPGESVLMFRKWVRALSVTSSPSYRVFCSVPPLFEAGLYITNRRVLVVASVLRLLVQEVSQWHAGQAEAVGDDVIRRLDVGQGRWLGPFLDVVSTSNQRNWYRSPELRMRLYMGDAEQARRIIDEFLPESSDGIHCNLGLPEKL
jgi:hypothetical protein